MQSPDAQEAQAALRELRETIGEKQYSEILVEVEPQAQLVVDQREQLGGAAATGRGSIEEG